MASHGSDSSSDKKKKVEDEKGKRTVKLDDSRITNSYANVCNVSSSREEVVLVFGINKAWERRAKDVYVELTDRIIISPYAAKRLAGVLQQVVEQYEAKFGPLRTAATPDDSSTIGTA